MAASLCLAATWLVCSSACGDTGTSQDADAAVDAGADTNGNMNSNANANANTNGNGNTNGNTSSPIPPLHITSCEKLFDDPAIFPNAGAGGSSNGLNLENQPDVGLAHTFSYWVFDPEQRALLLVEDGGLSSIALSGDYLHVESMGTISRTRFGSLFGFNSIIVITQDGRGSTFHSQCLGEEGFGYTQSTMPSADFPTTAAFNFYPGGTAILPSFTGSMFGLFSGAGSDLTLDTFYAPNFISYNVTAHADCGPPRDLATVGGTAAIFEKTGLSNVPYGEYKGFLQSSSGGLYGLLCANEGDLNQTSNCSIDSTSPSSYQDLYLVNITDPPHPALEGQLISFPGLVAFLDGTRTRMMQALSAYNGQYIFWGGMETHQQVKTAVGGWIRARITPDDHVTIFDVSDPLAVSVVDTIPVPQQDASVYLQGSFNRTPLLFSVHNDVVYLRSEANRGVVYRHRLGDPDWQALDFGESFGPFTGFSLSSDGRIMLKYNTIGSQAQAYYRQHGDLDGFLTSGEDLFLDRDYFLFDLANDPPKLISQGTLPYGYADVSFYHAMSWERSEFVDPLLVARGDGTYVLYLRSSETSYNVGLFAYALTDGPENPDCVCQPTCSGKSCGDPDGCGGYCDGCSNLRLHQGPTPHVPVAWLR